MNPLAIVLVILSAVSLVIVVGFAVSRNLQLSRATSLAAKIEPIDVQAFRNLVDPAEDEYLCRRLPAAEVRLVRRERLRATAAYVQTARRNAAALIVLGQRAQTCGDAQTAEAARQLVDNALLLRNNATFVLFRIRVARVWPSSRLAATPVLRGYERLSGAAMLLGRLQNPAAPVRISA
jgi:hypothetical protein